MSYLKNHSLLQTEKYTTMLSSKSLKCMPLKYELLIHLVNFCDGVKWQFIFFFFSVWIQLIQTHLFNNPTPKLYLATSPSVI